MSPLSTITRLVSALRDRLSGGSRMMLPLAVIGLIALQGCCCSKYRGYGGCNSCGGSTYQPYGAGYAPAYAAPSGGCSDGSCGTYPSAALPGVSQTAMVPGMTYGPTYTASAPVYGPVPVTAGIQPVPTF